MLPQINRHIFLVTVTGSILGLAGCAGREKPSTKEYLPETDQVVQIYGLTLDENAPPEQVAWALLMAIRDDIQAGQQKDNRKEAIKRQCQLANIELLRSWSTRRIRRSKFSTEEIVLNLIQGWAPIAHYYVDYIDNNFNTARAKMTASTSVVSGASSKDRHLAKHVDYTLWPESGGGPMGLELGATIRISLSKTSKGYWRVHRVGYSPLPNLKLSSVPISESSHGT